MGTKDWKSRRQTLRAERQGASRAPRLLPYHISQHVPTDNT